MENYYMRFIDLKNNQELDSVMIFLTPNEAKELLDLLSGINPKLGDHIHVADETYQREITLAIYTKENLHYFSQEMRKFIS